MLLIISSPFLLCYLLYHPHSHRVTHYAIITSLRVTSYAPHLSKISQCVIPSTISVTPCYIPPQKCYHKFYKKSVIPCYKPGKICYSWKLGISTHPQGRGGYPRLQVGRNGEHNAKLPREGLNKMFWASFSNRGWTLTPFGHPPQRLSRTPLKILRFRGTSLHLL